MLKTKISDVFFDLDHTLWDFEKNSALAFETILKKHGIQVDVAEFVAKYVPVNSRYWKLYQDDQVTQEQLRYGRLKDVFDAINYEISDETIHLLAEEYIHYLPQYNYLFEGTIELLNYLKPKYKLHIITNGFNEIQFNKLKNSNIAHYFETVTNSENAGFKKPNPQIFHYALEISKSNKETSVMIGDNFEADIEGALNVGIDAIMFNEHNIEVAEDIKQVNNLLALKNYL